MPHLLHWFAQTHYKLYIHEALHPALPLKKRKTGGQRPSETKVSTGQRSRERTPGSIRERFCALVACKRSSKIDWLTGIVALGGYQTTREQRTKRANVEGTHLLPLHLARHDFGAPNDRIDVGENEVPKIGSPRIRLGHLHPDENFLANEDAQAMFEIELRAPVSDKFVPRREKMTHLGLGEAASDRHHGAREETFRADGSDEALQVGSEAERHRLGVDKLWLVRHDSCSVVRSLYKSGR